MAYTIASVIKSSANAGMPQGKAAYVLLFDMDSVQMVRDAGGVKITAFNVLASSGKPVGVYVDRTTVDAGDEVEGDAGARGFIHHVSFQHPGTELEIAELKANCVNANLGAIVVPCDRSVTTAKVYGTPCAPLTMQTATEEDTSEAHRNTFQLRTAQRTWPAGIIDRTLIPMTAERAVNLALNLKATTNPIVNLDYAYTRVLDTDGKSPAAEGWYVEQAELDAEGRTQYTLAADATPVEGRTYYMRYVDSEN